MPDGGLYNPEISFVLGPPWVLMTLRALTLTMLLLALAVTPGRSPANRGLRLAARERHPRFWGMLLRAVVEDSRRIALVLLIFGVVFAMASSAPPRFTPAALLTNLGMTVFALGQVGRAGLRLNRSTP